MSEMTEILDSRIDQLLSRIQQEEMWQAVTSPKANDDLVQRLMREIYLEIYWYQEDVIEATIHVIGQMPRSLSEKTIKLMLFHQAEEWDHGDMALRDYVNAGGSETFARTSRSSPSAMAVAAYWTMLAKKRDPFAYLGALYLFEGLTPLVTGLAKSHLKRKGMSDSTLEYVQFHSTEDLKHQQMVKKLINDVAGSYPNAAKSMLHGYDCFEFVYPLPAWRSAWQRALEGGSERLAA